MLETEWYIFVITYEEGLVIMLRLQVIGLDHQQSWIILVSSELRYLRISNGILRTRV